MIQSEFKIIQNFKKYSTKTTIDMTKTPTTILASPSPLCHALDMSLGEEPEGAQDRTRVSKNRIGKDLEDRDDISYVCCDIL
jgi:hypothetical protein